ncbi:imelysin family protein [Halioxenophilus aromaticivorans]|uniref:Imelysin family protein n=1 Tax=Halioxenophilus aromaticivorans TaxID=1306992 RepID=A0AAV3U305_9ALTE
MKTKFLTASIAAASISLLAACGGGGGGGGGSSTDNSTGGSGTVTTDVINIENVQKVLETNADIALAAYSDSVDTALELKDAIDAFAATAAGDRTQADQDNLKRLWLISREPYGQTEVYRFRLSPIDSTDYASEDGPEGDINAWPLGEALIDYVQNVSSSDFEADQVGVIANGVGVNADGAVDGTDTSANIISVYTADEITVDLIANTATADDEHDVVAGYHAIEFMLWGQDLNDNALVTYGDDRDQAVKANGAGNVAAGGQRPLTDFTSDAFADRRVKFMQVVAEKLVADLESVRDGWLDDVSDNYRDQFTAVADRDEAIQKLTEILTGMGTLSEGELAGERMQIAFSSNSQEDEHSCFSDNTHRDIWLNAEGVANSYYGDYAGYDSDLDGTDDVTSRAVSGYGFDDYVAEMGIDDLTAAADALETALSATETDYMAIDSQARAGMPVDVLIMDANRNQDNPMYSTILSLNAQSAEIANIATALEISATVVDDDASGCDTTDPDAEC